MEILEGQEACSRCATSASAFEDNLKNLYGTIVVDSVKITDESAKNLERLAKGHATCSEIVDEIIQKYMKRI